MRLYIAPYKLGSKSAKNLAGRLNVKRTKANKRFKRNTMLINWGRSSIDFHPRNRWPVNILNSPECVAKASNKLQTFKNLDGIVNIPDFTTSRDTAKEWLEDGKVVYARKKLSGNSGDGLVVCDSPESELPIAPLYTMGIVRSHEYRVHVFNEQVIDFTKKRRRNEMETNDYVKNLENGWVFCREGIELPESVSEIAIEATHALGLDFAALDIITKNDVPYVLEVNTAPGLEGTTLTRYVDALERHYE